jgi:hypothetical protein
MRFLRRERGVSEPRHTFRDHSNHGVEFVGLNEASARIHDI